MAVSNCSNDFLRVRIFVSLVQVNLDASQSATSNDVFEMYVVLVMATSHTVIGVLFDCCKWRKMKNSKLRSANGKSNATNLVGDGLLQLIMFVGNVTCNGLVSSASLRTDQFSASNVKSSQLWEICSAVCISRSWLTSRELICSAHSSWRNWETRGVKRGNGPGFVANGLKPVE